MAKPEHSVQSFLRRFWPVLVLALLPLIPLGRAVFLGQSIGPFDQIRQMSPWNGPKPSQPWDVLQADGVLQFQVWRDLVFDSWGHGHIPFWNPYQLAGTPLLANSQSAALYPPHILLGVLQTSTETGILLLAWLHLFWSGLGAYFLARRLTATKVGGFVAGASFCLSSFMIAWTGLPSVIETVSWIPWVLVFISQLLKPESKQFLRPFLFCSASVAMMILAGHLQFVAYGMIAAVACVIWMTLAREKGTALPIGRAGACLLTLGFGALLASPQLLSVLNYSKFSHRRNVPTAQGYSEYIAGSIQPYELAKAVIPSIQGNPRVFATDLPVSTYYPGLVKPGANFAESAVGLGSFVLLLLCLLPVVARWRDPVWGIFGAGVIGALIAFGTPFNKLFYYLVPGWSSTGSPGRAICLLVLAVCVCAGVAVSRLAELKDNKRKLAIGFVSFGVLATLCLLLKNGYSVPERINPVLINRIQAQAEAAALPGGLAVTALALFAVFFRTRECSLRSAIALVLVPVVTAVAYFGTSLIQTGTADLKVSNTPGMDRIAVINNNWDILSAQHATLPPNLAALNRIHSLDGYDSLLHKETVALLHDIDGQDPAPPANGNIMYIKPTFDIKKLVDAGVTEVWSQRVLPELGAPAEESGFLKYRISGPGRASTPNGPAQIISETSSEIKVHAIGPGKLIVRERNMPGWSANIDDKAVNVSGSLWIELELPAGDHQVTLSYCPPGFLFGLALAGPGWLLVLLLGFLPLSLVRRLLPSSYHNRQVSADQ